ncbi:hypothetical protein HYDPIDRAFT_119786 [Hydnomerulius pinastri MD-312]|uniref:Uncharacterized protein n=1 Tax=Hydnomerulius pinastri MD-312 TaxID=994086 RepID=A0A0C9VKZ8_9AGAM|nr:hypothetical protein HYDPIDRAFT_119786 [Hydnomerulius pinastri MD-312]
MTVQNQATLMLNVTIGLSALLCEVFGRSLLLSMSTFILRIAQGVGVNQLTTPRAAGIGNQAGLIIGHLLREL